MTIIFGCNPRTESTGNETGDSFSFAFLTDIHLQPERDADQGFRLAITRVNELKPDFVVTGGDLIMDALGVKESRADSLYDMYFDISKEFDMPVYNAMGNHEVFGLYESSGVDPQHPLYSKKMFEEKLGKRFYSFNHKGWHFIILDAIGTTEDREYYGYIDGEQIDWLKMDLKKLDESTPLVVIVHIPFITSMTQLMKGPLEANSRGIVITNGPEVLEMLYDHNIKLVLQGHLHFLEDIFIMDRVHFLTGGAVSASWWKGPNGEMEEGFVMIHVKGGEIHWEYIDFGWDAASHNVRNVP